MILNPFRIRAYRRTDARHCPVESDHGVRLVCFGHSGNLLSEARGHRAATKADRA